MAQTRYTEARTLVRRLCRLPGENPQDFKRKVLLLRQHFEHFNVDASEICQWIMGQRKRYNSTKTTASFGVLGDFLLYPEREGVEIDEARRDQLRLVVFDAVAGIRPLGEAPDSAISPDLRAAMDDEAEYLRQNQGNATARRLFDRLRNLAPGHRLVLLKAAAEWIVARYQRGFENWMRRYEEWEKEKRQWESRNPQLTEEARRRFREIFEQLGTKNAGDVMELRREKPRICPYERLRGNLNNCIYAGEKGHSPLCWKFVDFARKRKEKDGRFDPSRFYETANEYLAYRHGRCDQSHALQRLFPSRSTDRRKSDTEKQKFLDRWKWYKAALGFRDESNLIQSGRVPHCSKVGGTCEKSQCAWNPHTHLCMEYKRKLDQLDDSLISLEPLYRSWRRSYLCGPSKPKFRYPSSRELPMPKIFGQGFHEIDFDRSVLRLRLEDMRPGEWLEFGFIPWPRGYTPSREEVRGKIKSVHVHFAGAKARVGFRFDVPHKAARFDCTQDELDYLRSRQFPRGAQDQEFLHAAREKLLRSFTGGEENELRVMSVDMGMGGAHIAVYRGRQYEADAPLPIIKINKAYTALPEMLEQDDRVRGPLKIDKDDARGLRKEHVGRHLRHIADAAARIAKHRKPNQGAISTLRKHDLRRPKLHLSWMVRDWARHVASRIIAQAEAHRCDVIVFESLRGSRMPDYDKLDDTALRQKAERVLYAYGRVRRKVTEKAVERGMRVVTAPYHKSSRTCSQCGREQKNDGRLRDNKKGRKFICEYKDCGAEFHSDANAARVVARVFWGDIRLPQPENTC